MAERAGVVEERASAPGARWRKVAVPGVRSSDVHTNGRPGKISWICVFGRHGKGILHSGANRLAEARIHMVKVGFHVPYASVFFSGFRSFSVWSRCTCRGRRQGREGWKSSRFWFSRPAEWKDTRPQKGTGDTSWAKDATPIGNGRIGALIYGGVGKDHLELTEISMWSGGFCSSEAKDKGPDSLKFGSYQPFGTLEITYPAADGMKDYRRELDVGRALASVSYSTGMSVTGGNILPAFPIR